MLLMKIATKSHLGKKVPHDLVLVAALLLPRSRVVRHVQDVPDHHHHDHGDYDHIGGVGGDHGDVDQW